MRREESVAGWKSEDTKEVDLTLQCASCLFLGLIMTLTMPVLCTAFGIRSHVLVPTTVLSVSLVPFACSFHFLLYPHGSRIWASNCSRSTALAYKHVFSHYPYPPPNVKGKLTVEIKQIKFVIRLGFYSFWTCEILLFFMTDNNAYNMNACLCTQAKERKLSMCTFY